jgi:hypothetical protein
MPDAINASKTDEGPTSGTTVMPIRCAVATRSAPGSATPGHPTSDSNPTSCPACTGANSSAQRSGVGVAPSSAIAICWTGSTGESDFKKARAGFAFSTTKCESPRASVIVRRQHGLRRRAEEIRTR